MSSAGSRFCPRSCMRAIVRPMLLYVLLCGLDSYRSRQRVRPSSAVPALLALASSSRSQRARSLTTTLTLPDLPRTVRGHPLASAGVRGGCYSPGYSPARGERSSGGHGPIGLLMLDGVRRLVEGGARRLVTAASARQRMTHARAVLCCFPCWHADAGAAILAVCGLPGLNPDVPSAGVQRHPAGDHPSQHQPVRRRPSGSRLHQGSP